MIYVYLGKEINIIKKRIELLLSELIHETTNIIKYDLSEKECDLTDVLNEANYVDLFNEKKIIIVSNFSFKKLNEKENNDLIKYIENMSNNYLIFKCIDESLDERKKITKLIREKCNLTICEKLDYKNLHQYVSDIFKENNKKITYNQVKKILDLCEYNTDVTLNEVDKLLLYKISEETIFDEDIDNVISKSNEKELFDLVDYVMNKDIKACLNSYKIISSSNIDEMVIIDSIAKQFRSLFQVKTLMGEMNEFTLCKSLGIKDFVIKKLIGYSASYTESEILDILHKLSDLDIDIKVNGIDKNKALESFFLSL